MTSWNKNFLKSNVAQLNFSNKSSARMLEQGDPSKAAQPGGHFGKYTLVRMLQ